MTEENKQKFGHGPFSNEGYCFITIEQKISALRMWCAGVRRWMGGGGGRGGRRGSERT